MPYTINRDSCAQNNHPNVKTQEVCPELTFDPSDHGREDGIGAWGAFMHVLRCSMGTSILLMPFVVMKLGLVAGPLAILSMGALYFRIVHILLSIEYRQCRRLRVGHLSFIEVLTNVLESSPTPLNRLRNGLRNLMYVYFSTPLGGATRLVLMATVLQDVGRHSNVKMRSTVVISALVVPLTMFCMCRKLLTILVPFSSVTNAFTLCMVALIAVESSLRRVETPSVARPFGDLGYLPQASVLIYQTFSCSVSILTIKNGMRRPRHMVGAFGALNAGAMVSVLTHCVFGWLVYFNFGDEVRINVLSNLSADNVLLCVVEVLFLLSLSVAYMLGMFAVFDTVWSDKLKETFVGKGHWYAFAAECGLRIGLNAVAYALAIGLPNLMLISSVAGTMGIVLDVTLIGVLDLLAAYADKKLKWQTVATNASILSASFVLFGVSLTNCVRQIMDLYSM